MSHPAKRSSVESQVTPPHVAGIDVVFGGQANEEAEEEAAERESFWGKASFIP